MKRTWYIAVAAATVLGVSAPVMASAASAPAHRAARAQLDFTLATPGVSKAPCATPKYKDAPVCFLLIDHNYKPVLRLKPGKLPSGLGPSQLQSAYKLPSKTAGKGQTIAVIEAASDPKLASDLAVYRKTFGLPPCTKSSGCLKIVNGSGGSGNLPGPSTGWSVETMLDIEMDSAVCPLCHIVVVESNDLDSAQNGAVKVGAHYISNSWGTGESSGQPDGDYNHKGVVDTASAGDSGFGVSWPATSRDVVAVGGTVLSQGGGSRGWGETVWPSSGGGCSKVEKKQAFQKTADCGKMRTDNDVSAVASGIAEYDTFGQGGWIGVGGTSVSAPIIAAVYALAANAPTGNVAASTLYAHPGSLFDITSGSNGSCSPSNACHAGPGYDGPSGVGTPDGVGGF